MSAADSLRRLTDIAERAERRGAEPDLQPFRLPGKEYDALGRAVPRNPFRGKPGVVLALRMGLATQFAKRVPEDYTLGDWILCTCGELQAVGAGAIVECAGLCSRWFFNTGESMRVVRWERDDDD